jgi:hypothetical protein
MAERNPKYGKSIDKHKQWVYNTPILRDAVRCIVEEYRMMRKKRPKGDYYEKSNRVFIGCCDGTVRYAR